MNIPKISLGCCPKPKNNTFSGANISKEASEIMNNYVASHPEETDIFNKISAMDDVSIALDSYSPNNIQYLVLRKASVPNYRIIMPMISMKKMSDCLNNLQ